MMTNLGAKQYLTSDIAEMKRERDFNVNNTASGSYRRGANPTPEPTN